ncbi:MAG: 50S ribosomal protein L10 [Candidatus Glassbacteria bacterium]|nr:50S ribosomal protein L10 [Candidatus Glassbacteria bacterium]
MNKKEKQAAVDELKDKLSRAESVFLTDFTGVNVKDVSGLRNSFREAEVEYMVAKNTLVRHAVQDTPWQSLEPFLVGPTALVISSDQGVTAAKIISKFRENHEGFKPKVGMMNEQVVDASTIEQLAKLLTRDELIAKLMGSLNSSISGLVFVLNDTIARAVRVLAQVAKAKESAD